MSEPLKVAVAGLGTVGAETVRILERHDEMIAVRAGRPVRVTAVSARSRGKDRGVSMEGIRWFDNAVVMAADAGADVLVEVIGGAGGIAREAVKAAIANGLHVVTANKALLAVHGFELAEAAEARGVALMCEAAVAGGVPVVKVLREGLAANDIERVTGILNGTCNYILTAMRQTGCEFADVLAEAQRLGYAESDPAFDIDGIDAAHKLALLTSLAFGTRVDFDSVHVEGIRNISVDDIAYAEDLGYRIKLLGIARKTDHGIEQRVHPCMVKSDQAIAQIEGVFNAVMIEGDAVGRAVLRGRGAGAGPTASAVLSDVIDIAAGRAACAFGVPASRLKPLPAWSMDQHEGAYYVRLMVRDQPGVFADIAAALRDATVSMRSIIQQRSRAGAASVALTVHETREAAMKDALARLKVVDAVLEPPHMIRITSP